MTQWLKVLAEDLSSVPRMYMVEGRNQLPQVVLMCPLAQAPPHPTPHTHGGTHMHTANK